MDPEVTPEEEEFHAQAKELDQRESDLIELLGELDKARAELDAMRDQRDALARYIENVATVELAEAAAELERMRDLASTRLARLYEVDPIYQPSAPRDRARFAGEDHDDYALRGE